MGIIQEFKEFAVKGNALDMAVGIIIGAAFNSVVQSLVNDVIMPPLGWIISNGQVDFKNLMIVLAPAKAAIAAAGDQPAQAAVEAVAIRWGLFVNTVINFLIVAWVVFIMVKMMNKIVKKREPAKA
jgi:large conductance mechanosensitive channel